MSSLYNWDMNKVQLLGHVTFQGEVKETTGGFKLARFGLATNKSKKTQDGGYTQITTFHSIACWGPLAERIQKYSKGTRVFVEGSVENSEYTNKKGEKVKDTYIVADKVFSVEQPEKKDWKKPGEANPAEKDYTASKSTTVFKDEEISITDLPF